ncbi:MAG: hypothetical protein PQJ50_14745 [Spirochaetales bacterium]|nr:hypothetical protein [Spirochaetales bacterium]
MSDIDLKIEELRSEMDENIKARNTVWRELGRILLDEGESDGESELMQEYRGAALDVNSRISLMDQQIQDIEEADKILKKLKAGDDELKERRTRIQGNLNTLQETLGEELFHLVNSKDLDVEWKKAFDPLIKNIGKIRDNETELYQVETDLAGKSFFSGLMNKSRRTFLKTRKKTMEVSQSKLYQKCFTDALMMGAGKGDDDAEDVKLLAPWFRADKEWQTLLSDEEKASGEKETQKERLKELCGARGPKKRIEFLEKEKALEEERLEEALRKWGESITGDTPDTLTKHPAVKEAVGHIDTLTEAAIKINLEIEKWEARKDIEKLSNDQIYMEQKIQTLEEEIQARRQEIKVLKKDIAQTGKDIEKKRAFTGDEE